jgi:RNA polymerase sigma-70 factor (ECF subfamily)
VVSVTTNPLDIRPLETNMQIAANPSMICAEQAETAITELDNIDALVAQYWPRVLRYVSFSINDADLAQSITQDCFLKAYRGRASFRGECAVSTWLISIANNLIRDQVRLKKFQFWRKANATAMNVSELEPFLRAPNSSPELRLIEGERVEQVRDAIENLSVNQRKVFLLRFFEGLNIEEIADSLGMPENTVKTHLHRGITAIRTSLGGR